MFAILFVSQPTAKGRCDRFPLKTTWQRFRFYSIECVVLIVFCSSALRCGDPYGVAGWLGNWALWAYCFHVAWHRLLPQPWAAIFTFACIPLFYLLDVWQKMRKRMQALQKAAG